MKSWDDWDDVSEGSKLGGQWRPMAAKGPRACHQVQGQAAHALGCAPSLSWNTWPDKNTVKKLLSLRKTSHGRCLVAFGLFFVRRMSGICHCFGKTGIQVCLVLCELNYSEVEEQFATQVLCVQVCYSVSSGLKEAHHLSIHGFKCQCPSHTSTARDSKSTHPLRGSYRNQRR